MKSEHSAGGVIIKKYQSGWKLLLIKDMNSSWTFPKGLVEAGERLEETAAREISEEVGLTATELIKPLTSVNYTYKRKRLVSKKVDYFLFVYKGREKLKVQKEEGIKEAKWVDLGKAEKIVGYGQSSLNLIKQARQYINEKSTN